MIEKRFIPFAVTAVTAAIGMYLVAGMFHEILFAHFFERETDATHEGIGIIFVAYLILGALMTFMFRYTYKGVRPLLEGLCFGMVIGVLWVFPHELAMAGAHGKPLSYVIFNGGWHVVEQGLGGIIIGKLYQWFRIPIRRP